MNQYNKKTPPIVSYLIHNGWRFYFYLFVEVIATPTYSSGGSSGVNHKPQYSEYRETGTSHNTLVAKC